MRAPRGLALLLAGVSTHLTACHRDEAPASVAAPSSAAIVPVEAAPFVYADVRRVREPTPLRFLGRLPVDAGELDGDWRDSPPPGVVRGALCAGDRAMQVRFLAAVRAAHAMSALTPVVVLRYADLAGCGSDAACEWLARESGATEHAPPVRAVLWRGLARCTGEHAALESDAVPDAVVLDVWTEREAGTWSPRLARAAEALARPGRREKLRQIGVAIGRFPEAVELVARLQARLPDPTDRALLAVGLGGHDDPSARRLYGAACAEPEVRADPRCQAAFASRPATLEARVRSGADVPDGPDVRAVAARCAVEPRVPVAERANCLARLAIAERARAREVAGALLAADAPLGDLARALARFPDGEALATLLRAHRLLPEGARARRGETPLLTAEEMMLAHGRARNVERGTGRFPNEHEELLAELAGLARGALAGAAFDEVPPADDDGPYVLRAWIDGQRYEVDAEDLGAEYDVRAALGLVNTLLRERRSELRAVALPTGDGTLTVAIGPAAGLLAARADALLTFEGGARVTAPVPVAPAPGGARDTRLRPAPQTGPLGP